MIYLELFWAFFQIGLFSIGGGYAALPLIQQQIVNNYGWLTVSEFADLIIIAESTPGPIALNAATFVGTRVAGFAGAVIATIGFIAPSAVIIALLLFLYNRYKNLKYVNDALRGLRPAVVGFIAAAALTILKLTFFSESAATVGLVNIASLIIFTLALIALRKFKIKPIMVLIGSGILGLVIYGGLSLI
ncbi:MAG TPA: chromate transporter [Clostridiales bacterium]|nr:chromate transporter [Clostridiales bacterium]